MKKVLTIVLDGFGWSDNPLGNAVKLAPPTNFLEMWNQYPHTTLKASEENVGLEPGQFGNSEVGHMTIGAGHKILQSITLIREFLNGNSEENVTFSNMLTNLKLGKNLHVIGLLSNGKVHSSLDHFLSLLDVLKRHDVSNVYFHIISDGRDTDTKSLYTYISKLEEKINETGIGQVASVCGRYYAMDRDRNWERTSKYYNLLTKGEGILTSNVSGTIDKYYSEDITDEFLPPFLTGDYTPIKDGDCILWMNYRTDRAKQLLSSFTQRDFSSFEVIPMPNLNVYTLLPIDDNIITKNFLTRKPITNSLGVYLSKQGLSQARIAETEKYAHVTFFFDGENNLELEGCKKFLIPSPKVATYDLKPEMSAYEITDQCIECMNDDYDFIFMNYANPDMVGHTGNLEATIKACKTVDNCLRVLKEKAEEQLYTMIILADHGNADQMIDEEGNIVTTHTTNLVPFIITDKNVELIEHGDLTNVAPTILSYMGLGIPPEMQTTKTLLNRKNEEKAN